MDVARPYAAVSAGVDADLLVALAGSTVPRSGRELARRTNRSNTGVQHVLERLVRHGLVNRIETGRAYLYTLNREHLLALAVEQMAEARTELVHRLRDSIGDWKVKPVHASLFGSTARGDGNEDSDVDLLVVKPDKTDADDPTWRGQLDRLAESVEAWTGNHAGIAEVPENELTRLRRDRPSIVEEVRQDAIDLAGKSAKALLGRL